MRILILAAEPIDADVLGDLDGDAEVLVVAPAQQRSPLRFWMSDADEAIAKADHVQEETVERLDEQGVDAAGDTGETDPLEAIQDALATFEADRIIVVRHPEGDRDLFEEDVVDEARARFEIPVDERTVTR
jgi:hypothetical protein